MPRFSWLLNMLVGGRSLLSTPVQIYFKIGTNTFSAFKKISVEKGSSRWCRGFCFGRCCWSPAAVPRRFFRACALRSFAPLCRTRCSRPESGAMTSSPSVTIILVYVAAASYLLYWVGLMGIHLIAILYGWVASWMVVCLTVLKTGRWKRRKV